MNSQETWRAEVWDDLYLNEGLYSQQPPMPFVEADVAPTIRGLAGSFERGAFTCLDIGIGNGRNLPPLMGLGLARIVGLDISSVALGQLRNKLAPQDPTPVELLHGDLSRVPEAARFAAVLAIQVFQHGSREEGHHNIRTAQQHVASGGLFALCVEATTKNPKSEGGIERHEEDDSYTRYCSDGGPIHAFSRAELDTLFADFEPVQPARYIRSFFPPPIGVGARWEEIWRAR